MQKIRFKPRVFHRLFLPLLAAGLLSLNPAAMAGRLYKWVDDQGKTHYGDSVPPEYAKKERKVLNDQGVQVETLDAAKTPEQIAEEKRQAAERQAEEKRQAEQAAHDRMLLSTFTTVDDMVMTRDGKIAAIDAVVRITEGRITKLEAAIEDYTRQAADLERAGKPLPAELNQRITEARDQVGRYKKYIQGKHQEQETIRKQFEADIGRFRELQKLEHQAEEKQKAENQP